MKVCTTCRGEFPLDNFNKDKQKKDGLNPRCKTCSRAWHHANKSRVSEYQKNYYQENLEYHRCKAAKYRDENRSKLIGKSREWYEKNQDKAKRYRQSRSKDYATHARNRRARILLNGGEHTQGDIDKIYDLQSGRCALCKSALSSYHVDHVYPLAKGGSNGPENLQILCPSCNMKKNDSDPIEYAQRNGFLL